MRDFSEKRCFQHSLFIRIQVLVRACVVVERGRGSTTTIALEIMKELFGVEGSLKILVVAMNIAARARE